RAHPAGGLQLLEHHPLVLVSEAVQSQRVLPYHQARRQGGLGTGPHLGGGRRGALQREADATAVEHDLAGTDGRHPAPDERDHLVTPSAAAPSRAASSRAMAPPRHTWQIASARASL